MQNKIHKINSPGLGSPLFMSIFFTLLALATASHKILAEFLFRCIKKDVLAYIEYAANIFNSNGFSTFILSPAHVLEHGFSPAAMPANRLLHPLFIALFRLVTDDWLVAGTLASALFFVISAPVIYFLARKLFSPRTALLAASIFAMAVPGVIAKYIICGYSEYAFLFPLFLGILIVFSAKNSKTIAAAGIIVGLAGLARPALPACLPPCLFLVFLLSPKQTRIKDTALFFICTLLPTMSVKWINIFFFGNAALYRNPITEGLKPLICYTRLFHHMAPIYHTDLKNLGTLFFKDLMFASLFWDKLIQISGLIVRNFTDIISGNLPWLGLLALCSLFTPSQRDAQKYFKWFYVAMLLSHILSVSVFGYFPRYFFPTLPITIILAASFVAFVIEKIPAGFKSPVTVILCIALAFAGKNPFPKAMTWEQRRPDWQEIMASKECFAFLDSFIPENAPVVSDLHARVFAWRTNYTHPIMLLPRTFGMFEQINRKISLDTIVIVPGFIYEHSHEWKYLYKHPETFLGFIPHKFQHGISHSVVFTRDGNRLADELTAQSKTQEDTAKQLELLGMARLIRPGNEQAQKLLESAQKQAQAQGARIIARTNEELTKDNIQESWKLAQEAGRFVPGLQMPELIEKSKEQNLLTSQEYNPQKNKRIKMTISHFPSPWWLSDRRSQKMFFGFDTDICFDLEKSGQVEEVKIWINDNSDKFSRPKNLEIFSSTDNFNWTQLTGTVFTDRRHNGKILGLSGLNSFGRFFKVKIRSKPHRPVEFSEIILSGYRLEN